MSYASIWRGVQTAYGYSTYASYAPAPAPAPAVTREPSIWRDVSVSALSTGIVALLGTALAMQLRRARR